MANKLLLILLALSCVLSGYFYYKMNPDDYISPSFFALGLLGIVFSLIRNKKIE